MIKNLENCMIERKKCVINNQELEFLSKDKFPLFCGCVENGIENDVFFDQEWAISKDGVIQLKKLIPLDLLYKQGHDSGAIGALWEEHHQEFANFIMQTQPKSVVEIGGGHGKLAQNCLKLKNIQWTIIEPNPQDKCTNINYIDSFFHKEILNNCHFSTIIHSHTLEHIYTPHSFLEDIASIMGGGQDDIFSA